MDEWDVVLGTGDLPVKKSEPVAAASVQDDEMFWLNKRSSCTDVCTELQKSQQEADLAFLGDRSAFTANPYGDIVYKAAAPLAQGMTKEQGMELLKSCIPDAVQRIQTEAFNFTVDQLKKLDPVRRAAYQKAQAKSKPLSSLMKTQSPADYQMRKSYKYLEKNYQRIGDLSLAMTEVFNVFDDKFTVEARALVEKAIAALDVSGFLELLTVAMKS